jgi:glycosyltransferase involved in cell wall biosynthesis
VAQPDRVSIVIPAFDEGAVIGEVVEALRAAAPWREVIVVDDGSSDRTAAEAEAAGAAIVRHPYNKGNGAAVKSGIRRAIGEYILVMDGDGQHTVADALNVIAPLGEYDLVVGARSAGTQASGARRIGNGLLNWLAGYLAGRPIPDLTSGLRAARRECLREFLHLLPNGFSTPTTTTLAFLRAGYNVTFVPIRARRRTGQSKIRLGRDGVKFFLILLRVVTIFSPFRIFLPLSAAAFLVGLVYGTWTAAVYGKIPNGAVLLLMFSVVVFLVGLVSEQISALRGEGRER